MNTFNVKKTTRAEVARNWDLLLPVKWNDDLYIRCNSKGVVDWDFATVYQPNELVERGNYVVHK